MWVRKSHRYTLYKCKQQAKIGFWCAVTRRTKRAITRCVAMRIQKLQFFRYFRRRFFVFFFCRCFRRYFCSPAVAIHAARCQSHVHFFKFQLAIYFNLFDVSRTSMNKLSNPFIETWCIMRAHHQTRPGTHQRAMKYSIYIDLFISVACDPSAHRFGTTTAATAATTKCISNLFCFISIVVVAGWDCTFERNYSRTARVCERTASTEWQTSHKFDLISSFWSNTNFYRWYDSLKRID